MRPLAHSLSLYRFKNMHAGAGDVPADSALIQAARRLFATMRQPLASEFMRRNIVRELIYYVLCGSCGKQFLQAVTNLRDAAEIYEANSWIKENFRSSFTVEGLAEQRNMSVSLFHQKSRARWAWDRSSARSGCG